VRRVAEDHVATFEKDGERRVAMRPVLEGMRLAWQAQNAKLNSSPERFRVRNDSVTYDASGRQQQMTCIPRRRYLMWLATINPATIADPVAPAPARWTTSSFPTRTTTFSNVR
jgi:hypothetical protein